MIVTRANSTATRIGNQRVIVLIPLAGDSDKIFSWFERGTNQRIVAEVIVVGSDNRESSVCFSLEECQMGIDVARTIQAFCNRFGD